MLVSKDIRTNPFWRRRPPFRWMGLAVADLPVLEVAKAKRQLKMGQDV